MKPEMFCIIGRLPKPIRLVAGLTLIPVGLALLLTPFPGGVVLAGAGLIFLYCTLPSLRAHISRKIRKAPWIGVRLRPLLKACDSCTQKNRQKSCQKDEGKSAARYLPTPAVRNRAPNP